MEEEAAEIVAYTRFYQCGTVLCSSAFGLPPQFVILVLKFLMASTLTLVECSLIILSVCRVYLIFKVSNILKFW